MKILITTGIFRPEIGGPATYTPKIAQKLIDSGHEVGVITYSDKSSYDFDSEYSFPLKRVVRGNKIANYFNFFISVMKEIKNYDLVYSLDWFSAGFPVFLACLITRRKYVLRVGGGYIWEKYLQEGQNPVTLKEFYKKGLHKKYRILYTIIKLVLKKASHVIFNTIDQRELFEKYYFLDKEKTSTIFNPMPDDAMVSDRGEITKEIVFAGRFIVMKNIESMISAFHRANLWDFKLVLIGSGPQEGALRRLVRQLKIEDKVEFLPSMNQDDLYERIKNSYYVIVPSWTDISPNQINELLSRKIPFLITKENYLSIYDNIPLMIDPHSIEDIVIKMQLLNEEKIYKKFVNDLSWIRFSNTWDDVTKEHIEVFNRVI